MDFKAEQDYKFIEIYIKKRKAFMTKIFTSILIFPSDRKAMR